MSKPLGENVAWFLQLGVCACDPTQLGSSGHFVFLRNIPHHERESMVIYRDGLDIGWESASRSLWFRKRGSLIVTAAGGLVSSLRGRACCVADKQERSCSSRKAGLLSVQAGQHDGNLSVSLSLSRPQDRVRDVLGGARVKEWGSDTGRGDGQRGMH